jgi:hypothetical protein
MSSCGTGSAIEAFICDGVSSMDAREVCAGAGAGLERFYL